MPDDKLVDKAWNFTLERYVVFLRDVIEPAVFVEATPLEAKVWQCAEPVDFGAAAAADFAPVKLGFQWGPAWSTAWFKVNGHVPMSMAGKRVVGRFSTDTEALVWRRAAGVGSRGVPVQGLDPNRDCFALLDQASGGEAVEFYVEAACNHLFGHKGLQWDPPEIHRRWNSNTPGYFEKCELAVVDEAVQRLKWVYSFALQLAKELPSDSARAQGLHAALRRATNAVSDAAVSRDAPAAIKILEDVLRLAAGGSATVCHAVGHAHIDTAWLWPLRETRRKCLRTFSNVLRLMERYPEFKFLCSQAQQYEYVESDSPELFAQIKQRAAEGRWEPGGAMWIEPDCTCPSGESLVRQIIMADRYWRERFGDVRGKQRFVYLPDTFGFPAQLPQIMKLAGLDTFITNKLHWNSHNVFPHTTFVWRGLDGSEVLAHQTPGMDYNATMTPKELLRGERTHKNKDMGRSSHDAPAGNGSRWLQPFGFGDGGGGPTDWNMEFGRLSESCDGLPRVKFSSVGTFLDGLHADVEAARGIDPASVPVHDGELYLELHRGTYTTHAKMKQHNAQCEELLRHAEELAFGAKAALPVAEARTIKATLDQAWKLVLLNQFHDILPGSSITWVYEDAARDYAKVRAMVEPVIAAMRTRWADQVDASALPEASTIGRVTDVQGGVELANGLVSVRLVNGQIVGGSLSADLARDGLNHFALYEDRPRLWDAWDIDREIFQKGEHIVGGMERAATGDVASGAAAAAFERAIGRSSRLHVSYELRAGERFVRMNIRVDWREEHRILKLVINPGLRGPIVLGTQFGSRVVAGTQNTMIEQAAFERPFQRSVRVMEGVGVDRAFAIISPDKYGISLREGACELSLLRSSRYPDPSADIGVHSFSVGVALGTQAQIDAAEDAMCRPPVAGWRMVETDLNVEAITLAERSDEVIVRLLNRSDHSRRASVRCNVPVKKVRVVDLLERDCPRTDRNDAGAGAFSLECGAWELVTLALTRAE